MVDLLTPGYAERHDHSVRREPFGRVELDDADGDGSLVPRETCGSGGRCAGDEVHLET